MGGSSKSGTNSTTTKSFTSTSQTNFNLGSSPVQNSINSTVKVPTINSFNPSSNTLNATSSMSELGNNANKFAPVANQISNAASSGGGALTSGASNAAPVAGTALGALNAGKNFASGDNINGALDVASTGAAFIPVYGWAASAAIKAGQAIYNMINGAKQKKNQEAIQKSQKAAQESEQAATDTTNQAIQTISQNANQNLEQLKNNLQEQGLSQTTQLPEQNNIGYSGELPDIANLKQDLTQQVTNVPQVNIPDDTNWQPAQYITPDGITGGASPVEEQPVVQTGQVNQTQDNRGMKDHLMSFFGNVGKGFQENNSTSISPENFGQNTYTTEQVQQLPRSEEVGAYADELAKNGVKEDVINAYLNEGKNSGNKEIAQWIDNHRDLMDENGNWKPVNKVTQQEHKKGIGYRLGEGLGTAHRILSNPATQGLIAMGSYMKDGETPWYSLGKGVEWASNKARSDAYRRMVTGDNSASLFGGYSEKDLNALSNQQYKDAMARIYQQKADETTRHNQVTEGQKDRQLDINAELGKERNRIAWQNSRTMAARLQEMIRHNQTSEGIAQRRTNIAANKGSNADEFNANLAKYANFISNPNISEADFKKARTTMINHYGKDFLSIEAKLGDK